MWNQCCISNFEISHIFLRIYYHVLSLRTIILQYVQSLRSIIIALVYTLYINVLSLFTSNVHWYYSTQNRYTVENIMHLKTKLSTWIWKIKRKKLYDFMETYKLCAIIIIILHVLKLRRLLNVNL